MLTTLMSALFITQVAFPSPSAQAITSLYPFASFTFTTAGTVGYQGPSLAKLLTSYDTATYSWLKNSSYFSTNGAGIQIWTVPRTGNYQITTAGAQGVPVTSTSGGLGAIMQGTFYLTQGDQYQILVGQTTTYATGRGGLSSAGGGGSFVVKNGGTTIADILIIAGGGGGTSLAARATGSNALPDSGTAKSSSDGYAGGSNGNKGSSGDTYNGAGGGFLTGGNGTSSAPAGIAFINGGNGGPVASSYSNNGGGFGGGGSAANGNLTRYSGGGGYNGGGASNTYSENTLNTTYGGGGSSFNIGTNQSNSVGNLGAGYVTITFLAQTSSITLSGPTHSTFGRVISITASTSADGKVTFYARGKRIPNCINVATSSQVATCQYKIATRNSVDLTATLIPSDSGYSSSLSAVKSLLVANRTSNR